MDPAGLKTIFHEALERPDGPERGAYLDEACRGDAGLRAQVEALLGDHGRIGRFLGAATGLVGSPAETVGDRNGDPQPDDTTQAETTDGGTAAPAWPGAEGPGAVIGPYKLLQSIGEGGMGTVYMAEQTRPVKRTVALKLIKLGLDSRQVLARFEAERQALALMDHPHIARVLEAGATGHGRPYFVMELVKGIPITSFCDERRLTVRERLELAIPVCQAVQHAHQKGVIHRDLKPSNVLVALYDGKPVPKIIDFGVAKATGPRLTDHTMFTEFGAVVGTLEYMSPEQAELNQLDIDTRSDIYSLGVLLYELLAGTTPLDRNRLKAAGFHEVLRVIREDESQRPSLRLSTTEELPSIAARRNTEPRKLSGLVRGELDWIVMKALEKDRTRRYETANGLASDLRRYLDDEPVQACPPSAAYRFRKLARRNRAAVLTAAAVATALLVGAAAATWQAVRATRAEAAALAALEDKRQALAAEAGQRRIATSNEQTALAREAETEAVLDFVEGKVFAAARPEGQDGGLGNTVTLRKAVEAALPFVEKSFTAQPLIEARLRMTLGSSFAYLGEAKIAAEQYQAARKIYTSLRGPDHPDTLKSMNDLANSYTDLGRYAEALELHEETLALRKAKLGPDHPDTLKSMSNLADSHASFGRAVGRAFDAHKLREETLVLQKARLGLYHPDTLKSMSDLAASYSEFPAMPTPESSAQRLSRCGKPSLAQTTPIRSRA
jgi:serine/threonine protein kinase/tetratricopeptide (TPR) repeat protein